MNRIYKVLFNKTLGAYTAVSELASVKGKKAVKALAVGSLLAVGMSTAVQAADLSGAFIVNPGETLTQINESNNVTTKILYPSFPPTETYFVYYGTLDMQATNGDNSISGSARSIYSVGGKVSVSATGNNVFTVNDVGRNPDNFAVGIYAIYADVYVKSGGDTTIQMDPNVTPSNVDSGIASAFGTVTVDAQKLTINNVNTGIISSGDTAIVTLNVKDFESDTKAPDVGGISAQLGGKVFVNADEGNVTMTSPGKVINAAQNGYLELKAKNVNLTETGGGQWGGYYVNRR